MLIGIIILLFVLLIGSGAALYKTHLNIKKMTQQLEGISENFGTNELVRTNTRNEDWNLLVTKINRLITLYKQDQQLNQQKALELKREITNISHDLRTPLTSMKGFSELLEEDTLTVADKQAYLDIIQKKIDTLTATVDLFYEISQIESADEKLDIQQFSLGDCLIEALLAFHQDFEAKKLALKIDEDNFALPIWADKKATERIIINLIQNALRYGKSKVAIKLLSMGDFVILQATNDTDSLDAEGVKHVFERSYTADASRKDGQTGLGLYILRKLAEKQGGKAAARLEGQRFVLEVYFPR